METDSNDFLWQCAFTNDVSSMQSLVPNSQHELNLSCEYINKTEKCWTSLPHKTFDNRYPLELSVIEIKGNGVLDSVSGEVWEACLLLSAYILLHPNLFAFDSVLELGSGVGLPGLLIAELHSLVKSSKYRETVLSDNDPSCLESLNQLILQQDSDRKGRFSDDCSKEMVGDSDLICDNVLAVIELDWNAYTSSDINISDNDGSTIDPTRINGKNHTDTTDDLFDAVNVESISGRFKVLMGSALCYDDSHICLADTIKHFLDGSCKQVIIIQIGDRAGFGLMLTRLEYLGIKYTVEVVSEEIYDTAQQIGQKKTGFSHSVGTDYTNYHEGEVRFEKTFQFNSDMIQSAIDRCEMEEPNGTKDSCYPDTVITPTMKASRTNLIKTNRESFVILRVTAT